MAIYYRGRNLAGCRLQVSFSFTGYQLVTGKNIPVEFTAIVGPVIRYYFGKSTALEQPEQK